MELIPDKTHINDWLSDAACRTLSDAVTWHWQEAPLDSSAGEALAVCAQCAVVKECRQDMADQGDRYPYQVRGGLRHWLPVEHEQLPEAKSFRARAAAKRPPGRPATGFQKSTHLQDKYPLTGPDVNRDEYPIGEYPPAASRNRDGSNHKEGR